MGAKMPGTAAALHWSFMSALSNLLAVRRWGHRNASCYSGAAEQSVARTTTTTTGSNSALANSHLLNIPQNERNAAKT